MKRARQISLKECYSLLGLEKKATLEDLKRAYRRRAFELHPDLNPGKDSAAREFQLLNEAYVVLSHVLPPAAETPKAETDAKHTEQAQAAQAKATTENDTKGDTESTGSPKKESTAQAEQTKADAENQDKAFAEEQRRAAQAYAQEDILRDLLNDPFARRVFEDIYSEIHKQDAPKTDAAPAPPQPDKSPSAPASVTAQAQAEPKARKISMEWGKHSLNLDFSKGVKGVVKGWLRQQIDEEQIFKLPAASLIPGARIRLQIRRGFSDDISSVEITLPKDFSVGKPVRLRGLGKRIGPWQGDLYLTLEPK